MRGDSCGLVLKEIVSEIRDILKEMNQKLCHLIEQNRTERMLFRGREEK